MGPRRNMVNYFHGCLMTHNSHIVILTPTENLGLSSILAFNLHPPPQHHKVFVIKMLIYEWKTFCLMSMCIFARIPRRFA